MSSQLALFNKLRKYLLDGTVDFDTDTIKCALVTNAYTFDATHYKWADISAHEVVAVPSPYNGYDAGGATVTGVTITEAVSPVSAYVDCNDVDWYSLTATFKYAVFYASVTRNGIVNPLIGCVLLDYEGGGSIVVSGVDYKLQIASGGLLALA
jgi:hypothetical protein